MSKQTEAINHTATVAGFAGMIFAGLGFFPLPYGYYLFLRPTLVVICVLLALCAMVKRTYSVLLPLACIAVLFVSVKGLPKAVWAMLDLATAVSLVVITHKIVSAKPESTESS
jgi:O-antigen ligase